MINHHPIRILALAAAPALGITLTLSLATAGDDFTIETRDKIALQAQPFPLSSVRLLDGPFKHASATISRHVR